MASPTPLFLMIFFLVLASFTNSPTAQSIEGSSNGQQGFMAMEISERGLDFLKDLLISKAIASTIPLKLPRLEKSAKVPFLGTVRMVLTDIIIYEVDVLSSYVKPGDTGVAVVASGMTCNLSMNWYYKYDTWLLPIEISDKGNASVQVEGMEVGLTLGLKNQNGSLKLSVMECGCIVKDIKINVKGGASWFYQGIFDAFGDHIATAVESTITTKLGDGIVKVDAFLQSLPKEIPVDDIAALNVTVLKDPSLTSNSIQFDINGLFMERENPSTSMNYYLNSQSSSSVLCSDPSRMLGIELDEAVFNSACTLYYDAKFMQWIVDKVPDQSLLNTARWRFIVPKLYRKYPNHDLNLNISLSSPPVISVSDHKIDATVDAVLIINVLDVDQVIPVACISFAVSGSASVRLSGNNLAGNMQLDGFSMSQKWSEIGNVPLFVIQPVMWTAIETVFLPYVNAHLAQGIPLPIIHGFTLQNAETIIASSKITVCGDVEYKDELDQVVLLN
ncbi:Putative BPI/LBP family protein At1g04970 [Linum grandiflorum]